MYTATERLYTDANGKVVKADDPTRQSLLIGVGQTMPEERARELGLLDEPTEDAAAAEEKAAEPKANKAVTKAPFNKAAKG
jgi:hypothetical protein